jgi:hypothetical protein
MSRAHDLFNRLQADGKTGLEQLISDREPESLFLDFKRSPADGVGPQLAPEDNKNLSKGISGFGNSAGGVLVWGVDCRLDRTLGGEVATPHPLVDAHAFRTKVEGAISRATLYPHTGVQVATILEKPGQPSGFVAVLVPQWFSLPLRSTVTGHYHMRTGSDFAIVPHELLAGMFGRAPQPHVDVNYIGHPAWFGGRPDHFTLAFGIVAVNLGAVMGHRPYVTLFYGDLDPALITVQSQSKDIKVRRGVMPSISVIADEGVSIPPTGTEHLCDVVVDVPVTSPRAVLIEAVLGVTGSAPQRFRLHASERAIAASMQEAKTKPINNSLTVLVSE